MSGITYGLFTCRFCVQKHNLTQKMKHKYWIKCISYVILRHMFSLTSSWCIIRFYIYDVFQMSPKQYRIWGSLATIFYYLHLTVEKCDKCTVLYWFISWMIHLVISKESHRHPIMRDVPRIAYRWMFLVLNYMFVLRTMPISQFVTNARWNFINRKSLA